MWFAPLERPPVDAAPACCFPETSSVRAQPLLCARSALLLISAGSCAFAFALAGTADAAAAATAVGCTTTAAAALPAFQLQRQLA